MTKTQFKKIAASGREQSKTYMAVKIITEGNPAPEIIVNTEENFDAKLAYYAQAYDDDLELISAKKAGKSIKISDVLMTNNLNDLNWFIY